jgi:hypothetical protein
MANASQRDANHNFSEVIRRLCGTFSSFTIDMNKNIKGNMKKLKKKRINILMLSFR